MPAVGDDTSQLTELTVTSAALTGIDRGSHSSPAAEPGSSKKPWARPLVVLAGLAALSALALALILLVRLLLGTGPAQEFLAAYPGEYQPAVAVDKGFPAWARWTHFLNVFFIVLIVRSGLQVRHQKKPPAYWASKNGQKISINLWLHQALDILWLANGVLFVVLLFATGQWARIVPTSWEVFPNALSALLQYLSLDWPVENGWVNYNALQQLAYFVTVFVAAPLATATGVRMSGSWPKQAPTLNRLYPIGLARAIHFPTMLYFVVFVIFHVGLVFATGALRNLNHMYAGQDEVNWVGFAIFVLSLAAIVAAWLAARPLVLTAIAARFGRVSER
ncbi:cytochrome b/b6 domain-containing protein [Agrococcus sp. ARC_14]|uniref:cytochrome b/b6 domain-containing protein n=1 Tax=Agrococcus sp. ARC_14 TaxID=2919927 RepID=UPI001F05BF58|nr:cytochrome b/b6 domain-containing protein [Agrococcus sp. ARC_14]